MKTKNKASDDDDDDDDMSERDGSDKFHLVTD